VGQNSNVTYVVNAVAGQKMMINLSATSPTLALEVLTPQGAFMAKASDHLTQWQADLPASGNYLVSIVNSGPMSNFDLNVTLPVRVTFPGGATALSLAGAIQPHAIHTYLLKALKDQTMTVTIQSEKNDVFLTIYGATDGNPYVRSVSGQATFSFQLPSTQDYVIQCEATGANPENYSVTFNVQ
jgi:hypothetical protein